MSATETVTAVYVGDTPAVFVGQGKRTKGELVQVLPHEVFGEQVTDEHGRVVARYAPRADLLPASNPTDLKKAELEWLASVHGLDVPDKATRAELEQAVAAHLDGLRTALPTPDDDSPAEPAGGDTPGGDS